MPRKSVSATVEVPPIDPALVRMQALMASANAFQKDSTRMLRGGNGRLKPWELIPSGMLELDMAIGTGGIPRGRVIEIFGPFSCGKTTAALHFVANAQRVGVDTAYFDAEYALNPRHMKRLGVQLDRLAVVLPDNLEQAIELMLHMMESYVADIPKPRRASSATAASKAAAAKAAASDSEETEEEVDPQKPSLLIVVDSVAVLKAREVMESDVDKQWRAMEARVWSQNLPKLVQKAARTGSTIVLINQERSTMASKAWEAKSTTPGGEAIKYGTSIRITMKGAIEKAKLAKGQKLEDSLGGASRFNARMTLGKNKVGDPATIARFSLVPGWPIDPVQDVFAAALRRDMIFKDSISDWDEDGAADLKTRTGWYTYPLVAGDLDLIHKDEAARGVEEKDYFVSSENAGFDVFREGAFIEKLRKYPSLVEAIRERILNTLNDENAKIMDADADDDLDDLDDEG